MAFVVIINFSNFTWQRIYFPLYWRLKVSVCGLCLCVTYLCSSIIQAERHTHIFALILASSRPPPICHHPCPHTHIRKVSEEAHKSSTPDICVLSYLTLCQQLTAQWRRYVPTDVIISCSRRLINMYNKYSTTKKVYVWWYIHVHFSKTEIWSKDAKGLFDCCTFSIYLNLLF